MADQTPALSRSERGALWRCHLGHTITEIDARNLGFIPSDCPVLDREDGSLCGAPVSAVPAISEVPKRAHMVPDRPRWPSARFERGEGLLVTLPSLHRTAIYLSVCVRPRGRSHIGWGRQFLDGPQPRWAHYLWWGSY
jgi:hypothetical protein